MIWKQKISSKAETLSKHSFLNHFFFPQKYFKNETFFLFLQLTVNFIILVNYQFLNCKLSDAIMVTNFILNCG